MPYLADQDTLDRAYCIFWVGWFEHPCMASKFSEVGDVRLRAIPRLCSF